MKKKTFTDEQIVGILRGFEQGGKTIKEYCREKDVSEGTFYKWRNRFGTMEVNEVREYRQLQQENARLKRLLAERDLEIDVMKEVIAKKW
jgi:putative transposase